MTTLSQAKAWILDCDGSCRDVTFTPTTRSAAALFVQSIASQYATRSSNDNNGVDRSVQLDTDDPFAGIDGFIHIGFDGGTGLLPNLQLFIDHDRETNKYCVEVSFFPQDINRDLFSLASFLSVVDDWNSILKSDDYFIRYENASWKLYDPLGLGVICTRKTPPT